LSFFFSFLNFSIIKKKIKTSYWKKKIKELFPKFPILFQNFLIYNLANFYLNLISKNSSKKAKISYARVQLVFIFRVYDRVLHCLLILFFEISTSPPQKKNLQE